MSMYNLIEYTSNYSKTTGSLWCHVKDEETNFNADIQDTNNLKSFNFTAKLLQNTVEDEANGILKNATIAVLLKYLNNFWRLIEMILNNYKVELKLKWTKYCVLSAAGNENVNNNNANDIIFTIKGRKLYVSIVALSARDKQKLSKSLSKGFERSFYWNEYKTKNENKKYGKCI